jgi:Holliday junction resolvasome RuvABC ATP-dependent DNA helicase subunit
VALRASSIRLLRRVRDYADVDYDGRITHEVSTDALNRMEVDTYGLDEMDRKLLVDDYRKVRRWAGRRQYVVSGD